MAGNVGRVITVYFANEYIPYTRRLMNDHIQFGIPKPPSVAQAEKALKQAKAAARAAKRAKEAREKALATLHNLADSAYEDRVRLDAALALKEWGTTGDPR